MIIFACYNSFSSYDNDSWFDALSFGALGQATTFCSKVPNINEEQYLTSFNFFFQCDKDYFIEEVLNVGLLNYEENSLETSLYNIQTICYQEDYGLAGEYVNFNEIKQTIRTDCYGKE